MTNMQAFTSRSEAYRFAVIYALMALALALISLAYIRPRDCSRLCAPSSPLLCGTCEIGQQKAGWPLPIFVDMPGGGSPVSGWGRLGWEDMPNPISLVLDALFYSVLLWPIMGVLQVVRGKVLPLSTIVVVLPLAALLATFLWLMYMLFGPFRYA